MNTETFWQIIANARTNCTAPNWDTLKTALSAQLDQLTPDDLLHFSFIYEQYELAVINTKGLLWDALYIINGGYCSNTYGFAGWLISHGRKTYFVALQFPDSLARTDADKDTCDHEEFRKLAPRTYATKNKIKPTAYRKLESTFWRKPASRKETKALLAEIVHNKSISPQTPDAAQPFTNASIRKAQQTRIDALKDLLPDLYKKFGHKNITNYFK